MPHEVSLFGTVKQCSNCKRILAGTYENDLCPACLDNQLFQKVREYIRKNDVNEYDVATEFHIPVKKVKEWIREGRIEYRFTGDGAIGNMAGLHCLNCGAPVAFGSLCPKCMRQKNSAHGFGNNTSNESDNRMRFM